MVTFQIVFRPLILRQTKAKKKYRCGHATSVTTRPRTGRTLDGVIREVVNFREFPYLKHTKKNAFEETLIACIHLSVSSYFLGSWHPTMTPMRYCKDAVL